MPSVFRYAVSAAAVAASMPAVAQTGGSLAEQATAFGTRENVQSMAMSPSGTKVAMLTAGPGSVTVLQVADLTNGKITNLTKSDGRPQYLRWCNFAGEVRLVCRHSGVEPFSDGLLSFGRLFSIKIDGQDMKELGQRSTDRERYMRQIDGSVVDWLRADNDAVLMQRVYVPEINTTGTLISRTKEGLGVDRIDLGTMKSSQVEPPRDGINSYVTDGRGTIRLQSIPQYDRNSGNLTGKVEFRYRVMGSREWKELGDYDMGNGAGIYPLEVDADTDSLYALKKLNGRDALYRIKLDASRTETLVASSDEVDIDGVVRLGTGLRVVGYTFADDRRRTVYFDPEMSALQKALAKAVPNQPMIDFQGASADGQKLLIMVSGDTNPGTFYRFDRATKQLAEIGPVRPALGQRKLATVTSIRVAAPDGASIPAYLTLPPGSSGKNLPTVVMPHGGPSARDEWGFDWLAQFLAARVYAVIQPNYRGSAGYGEAWLNQNGFRGWRTSIGDVTASAKHLVAQGIADPNRLAIVGWSYGGYAALQSVATEPSLYKAAVAIAPVTDLEQLRKDAAGFTNERLVRDFVGSGPHLTEGSPLKNAASIRVPVLLAHGDQDINVAIGQSERMNGALKANGKQVEFLRFAGLDHQLDDSSARTQLLNSVGALLDRTIGH